MAAVQLVVMNTLVKKIKTVRWLVFSVPGAGRLRLGRVVSGTEELSLLDK